MVYPKNCLGSGFAVHNGNQERMDPDMFGLGKSRTPFGQWLDKNKILQREVQDETKLSQPIVTQLCNNPEYRPSSNTKMKVLHFIRKRGWKKVRQDDLWPL